MAVFTLVAGTVATSCSGSKDGPTTPSANQQTVSVQSLQATPAGMGVQFNTNFQFDASGTFPAGTQFVWQFGDGSTTTTSSARANKTFDQTGTFSVSVEARSGANSSAATRQVTVRSLVGRWLGTITGHSSFPANRPIPIPSFELVVSSVATPASGARVASMSASWSDNAGCRESRGGFIQQVFTYAADAGVGFGVESLVCNDGDLYFSGTADPTFSQVQGTCAPYGGANCRFVMVRQ